MMLTQFPKILDSECLQKVNMPASHNIRQVWEFMTRHGKSFDTVVKKASILIKMHDMDALKNELMLPLSLVTVTKCFGWIYFICFF